MMRKLQLRRATACLIGAAAVVGLGGHVWAGGYYAAVPPDLAARISALQNQIAALPPAYTDAQAAAASPVRSVNGQTGATAVPAYQRQVTPTALPVSTADGSVSWTYPVAFNNMPTCHVDLGATTTGFTFDYPIRTAISRTGVTYSVTSHPKALSIASLALPILLQFTPAGVPAGTTVILTCWAPM